MSQQNTVSEQFFDSLNQGPDLKAKFDAIMKTHEASKNEKAAAAEIAELAKSEGFDVSTDEVLDVLCGRRGELGEAELEQVSGGGSGLALCIFEALAAHDSKDEKAVKNGRPVEEGGGYKAFCGRAGSFFCTWAGCRCWNTSHCALGHHICDKNGRAFPFHAVTS